MEGLGSTSGSGSTSGEVGRTWPQHSVVDEVLLVSKPYHQNVAQLGHSVELRQELVDHRVAHATRVTTQAPSLWSQG